MLRELMRRGWFPNGPRFGFRVERASRRFRQHDGDDGGGDGGNGGGGDGGGSGDGDGGDGGGDGGDGGSGGGSGDDDKKFTQNDFNAAMKKQRDKLESGFKAQTRKTLAELEKSRKEHGLSAKHAEQLDKQIAEQRAALMTDKQKAAAEKDRISNEHKLALDTVTKERDTLKADKVESHIRLAISEACTKHDVHNEKQVQRILKAQSAFVEITDDEGKGTGKFKAEFTEMVKDGETFAEKKFSADELLAHMKGMDEHENLFKQTRKGGTGFRKGVGSGAGGGNTSGLTSNEKIDQGLRKGQAGRNPD